MLKLTVLLTFAFIATAASGADALATQPPSKGHKASPPLLVKTSPEGKACTNLCGARAPKPRDCRKECSDALSKLDKAARKQMGDGIFMKGCQKACADGNAEDAKRAKESGDRCYASCSGAFASGHMNVKVASCQLGAKTDKARMTCYKHLPADKFQEVLNQAKTTEAVDHLIKIAKLAMHYYDEGPRKVGKGKKQCAFPPSVPCMPTGTACKKKGESARFTTDAKAWNAAAGWKAMGFVGPKEHYFRYCFTSKGTGKKATFEIKAQADLDCDGTWSTYTLTGKGNGTVMGSCSSTMNPGLKEVAPLE